jgi:hypothetical protein
MGDAAPETQRNQAGFGTSMVTGQDSHGRYSDPRQGYDKHIKQFAGSPTQENTVRWLEQFEQAAQGNLWDDRAKLRWVGRYMVDAAATWWSVTRYSISHWQSYDDPRESLPGSFYHAFIKAFITPELQNNLFKLLMNCRQCSNEDVSQYAMRIRELTKRVKFSRTILDEQVADIFLQGLPMQLRSKILDYESDQVQGRLDFEGRVRQALKYELNCRFSGNLAAITPNSKEHVTMLSSENPSRVRPLFDWYTEDGAYQQKSTTPKKDETNELTILAKQLAQLADQVKELTTRSQRRSRPFQHATLLIPHIIGRNAMRRRRIFSNRSPLRGSRCGKDSRSLRNRSFSR